MQNRDSRYGVKQETHARAWVERLKRGIFILRAPFQVLTLRNGDGSELECVSQHVFTSPL